MIVVGRGPGTLGLACPGAREGVAISPLGRQGFVSWRPSTCSASAINEHYPSLACQRRDDQITPNTINVANECG
jgi:hypothetical protein